MSPSASVQPTESLSALSSFTEFESAAQTGASFGHVSSGAGWPSHASWNSNAPISALSPPAAFAIPEKSAVRVRPRWSKVSPKLVPWSIAGLPALSAIVWVGPPLLASGPSSGSATAPGQPVPAGKVRPKVTVGEAGPPQLAVALVVEPATLEATIVLTKVAVTHVDAAACSVAAAD